MRPDRLRTLAGLQLLAIILMCTAPLNAQRINSLGATVDVAGGIMRTDQAITARPGSQDQRVGNVGVYPALSFDSRGARSSWVANYAFGWDRFTVDPPVDSTSHSASVSFSRDLNPRSSISFNNSFVLSSNAQTFFSFRGVLPTADPNVAMLIFDPVATRQSVFTDNLGAQIGWRLSERSTVSLSGGYFVRDFLGQQTAALSNQQGVNTGLSFSRQISERTHWTVGYDFAYYAFESFDNTMTNSVRIGLSNTIAKDTVVSSNFGFAHSKNAGSTNSLGSYEASAALSKAIKGNTVSLTVSRNSGRSNGLASVSQTRMVGVGLSRDFGRVMNLYVNGSAFDSKGMLDNSFDSRGTSTSASIGFYIVQNLSVQVGGQYQRYTEPAPLAFTQKRLFASIRYSHPNLVRSR